MIGSEKVRSARKTAQKDRLAAKAKGKGNSYAEYYAAMPQQKVKAAAQAQIRSDREDVKDAAEKVQIAEIDGKNLLGLQERLIVARKVLQLHEAAERPNARISLTAAGEG
jgi:hypothetical protein